MCWCMQRCMWICGQTSTHTCCLDEKIHPMWSSQLSSACVGACLPLAKARLWLPPLNVPTAAANGQSLSQPLSGPAVCLSFLCLISSFTLPVLPSVKEAVIGHPGAQHLISTHRFVYVCVCLTEQPGHKHYCVCCGNTEDTLLLLFWAWWTDQREDSESQRVLSLGPGWSNPVRQTINVKRDGSGLKLSGCALVRTAGVGTFFVPCASHIGSYQSVQAEKVIAAAG